MVFRHLILLVAILLVVTYPLKFHAQEKPVFSNYEYTVTDDGTFGLYRPKGWNVGTQRYPNGRMVFASDQKDLSYVNIILLEKIDPKNNSVTFACRTLTNITKQMPDLKILQANSSRDRMHTLVKYQRSGPKNIPIEGRYCFNVKHPTAVVFGYEAPKKQFKEMIPTLLTIIANITVLDDKTYQRLASQRKDKGPKTLAMKQVSASDRTCRIMVPQGWNLTAEKGAAICASPDG